MTSHTPDRTAGRLCLAWFGHALGERADGLTTYSTEVVGGLRGRGVEVWFHHASRDGLIAPVTDDHRIGWPTWRFKTVTVPQLGFRRQMTSWLARVRPDVIHTSLSFTLEDGWLGRQAWATGAATVATFHLPFGPEASGRARVMRQLHRFWAGRLQAYQRVIVFSEAHRARLVEAGVERSRIAVLPNAVDTEVFCPGPSVLRQTRLAGASLVVGFAGRLDPEKGVPQLLSGFLRADLGPDARLIIAGAGALVERVKAAQRDPRVIYLGRLLSLEERVDFWRGVDVFCLPSNAEGLSLALLEAMATGCAVAATPEGGATLVGGVAAALDPKALSESVSQQLQFLMQEPGELRRRGVMARGEAERHHGMSAMLDRLLGIYAECLGRAAVDASSPGKP
ncbi:MAG: glycosyltransferase family 4 protein [Candidatus Dormiibacterota bacterium]